MIEYMRIDSYTYLCDGTQPGWVLVRRDDPKDFTIYNENTRMLFVVDDEEIRSQLVSELMKRKLKVLDIIPPGEFDLNSLTLN